MGRSHLQVEGFGSLLTAEALLLVGWPVSRATSLSSIDKMEHQRHPHSISLPNSLLSRQAGIADPSPTRREVSCALSLMWSVAARGQSTDRVEKVVEPGLASGVGGLVLHVELNSRSYRLRVQTMMMMGVMMR